MLNVKDLPLNKQFSRRLVKPDTWLINCYSESCEAPNPHVLIGERYALVIDTTDTKQDLRKYLEQYVTDKPLMVASTHSHGDHTPVSYTHLDVYKRQGRDHVIRADDLQHAGTRLTRKVRNTADGGADNGQHIILPPADAG